MAEKCSGITSFLVKFPHNEWGTNPNLSPNLRCLHSRLREYSSLEVQTITFPGCIHQNMVFRINQENDNCRAFGIKSVHVVHTSDFGRD